MICCCYPSCTQGQKLAGVVTWRQQRMSSPGPSRGMAALMPFYPEQIVFGGISPPRTRSTGPGGLPAIRAARRWARAVGCPDLAGRRWLAVPAWIGCPPAPLAAQPQPAPPNLETARFTSIHESVTSARFCASLQQAAGLCGWNFLLFCNTSFFFFFLPSIFLKQENGASHRLP